MSFYAAPSMIAMKYQRQPYVGAPLQPGQRLSVAREMETSVRGYREVNRELSVARSNWEQQQERARRSASQERAPPATFYKSVVGTRSTKGGGAIYFSEMVSRVGTFRIPSNRNF